MLWLKMRVKEERDEEPEEEEDEEEYLSNSSSSSIYVNSRSNNQASNSMVCDACGKRNAKWYCSADNAYLCHSCDQSVHAANAVSLRHERVGLLLEEDEEAPMNPVITQQQKQKQPPSRHDGSGESKSSNGDSVPRSKRRRSGIEEQCPAAAFGSPLPPASAIDLKDGNSPAVVRCKSKKMIKLEIPELVGFGGCCKQENELEQEQQNANVERDEEEVHTVPVFDSSAKNEHREFQTGEEEEQEAIALDESLQVANMGGSDHSPTSGIATEADEQDGDEEQEDGQETEEDSMDEADIERFLNSGADYCCDDDEDAEMGSLIAAPPNNTTTTTSCGEDLEFLGFCCDEMSRSCPGFEQQQQLDEDYFDFAIRKNNASVSDYGEVITGDDCSGIDSLKIIKVENEDFYLGDVLGGSSVSAGAAKLEHENYDQNFQQQMQQHHLQRRICLRLDYEDVLNAWSDRRPFLTTDSSSAARSKPSSQCQAVPEDSSASDVAGSSDVGVVPDLSCGSGGAAQSVDQAGQVPVVNLGDEGPNAAAGGGREARVTRYREKRRTRLFSKKIRYEVRKLNAERRPRLKGRFVKRSSNGD